MPVLANVLLSTDGSRLKLSATNLDLGITTWVTANVEEEGTVTVPARLITDLVNSMPVGQSVELREEEKSRTLTVKCQQSRAQVRGIDPEEFPPMPTAEDQADGQHRSGPLQGVDYIRLRSALPATIPARCSPV